MEWTPEGSLLVPACLKLLAYQIKPSADTCSGIFLKARICRFRNQVELTETDLILLPHILFIELWFSSQKPYIQWL